MKRFFKKFSAVLAVLCVVFSLCTVFASAANTTVAGTTTTFDKYLVLNQNTYVPNVTFNFTIAPGSAHEYVLGNEGVLEKFAVYAGNDSTRVTGAPTITSSVSFKPTDTVYSAAQGNDTVVLESFQRYAKKTVTLDFTGVTYKEPGIYRYVITESGTNDGVTNDSNVNRYCDVYVQQKTTSSVLDLEIAGYAIHEQDNVLAVTESDYADLKDNGFQNTYDSYCLGIQKQITGNQGFKHKYFKFTLNISNAVPGTRYTLTDNTTDSRNKSTASGIKGTSGAYYLEADESGNCTYTFYLSNKNGVQESIKLEGLTAATKYTISEENEDYTPSWTINTDLATGSTNNTGTARAMGAQNNAVKFVNTRVGTVPTGYILSVAPYAVIGIVAVAAFGVLVVLKRKEKVSE